jgi:hypothetical protein
MALTRALQHLPFKYRDSMLHTLKIELPWPISMIDVPGEGSNRVVDAKVIWAQDSSVLM